MAVYSIVSFPEYNSTNKMNDIALIKVWKVLLKYRIGKFDSQLKCWITAQQKYPIRLWKCGFHRVQSIRFRREGRNDNGMGRKYGT
jgi:hypothetical protein